MEDLRQRIAFLELVIGLGRKVGMAFHCLDPSTLREDDRHRFALDKGFE